MSTKCECTVCGIIQLTIEGKRHRRCAGSPGGAPREKSKKLPSSSRGKWVPPFTDV